METAHMKKILVVGVLAALTVAIGYPVAVWALNIAKPVASVSNSGNSDSDDSGLEAISAENIDIEDHMKAFGNQILIYGEKSHRDHREASHHISLPKIVLSAVVNVSSSNVQNVSAGDKVGLVLIKKGGNYSLLILIHHKVENSNRSKVYQVIAGNASVSVGSDTVTISGNITRSTLNGFGVGSTINISVKIGSASLSSGSSSISGDILALVFKR
ncbi:MAG: hypothetical protein QXE01_00830 [Sulfolobales archaeon]